MGKNKKSSMLKDFQFTYRKQNKISSPCHNDEWAARLFPQGGFFVEVGASTGVDDSSCYELEKIGWNGICVEPHTESFAQLVQNRSVPCENCCLMGYDGTVDFYECEDLYRQISRTHPSLEVYSNSPRAGKVWAKEAQNKGNFMPKNCLTLLSLLEKHHAPTTIEYLALDIEGSEDEVLRNFPFGQKYEILALSIENDFCDIILLKQGYKRVNNWMSKNEYECYYSLNDPNH